MRISEGREGVCLGGDCSIMLVAYFMWSGALGSPDLLLSSSMIIVAFHITSILIISTLIFSLSLIQRCIVI